jgi:hypothetical protein
MLEASARPECRKNRRSPLHRVGPAVAAPHPRPFSSNVLNRRPLPGALRRPGFAPGEAACPRRDGCCPILARIEDLRHSDLVKVDCATCHHVALLTPEFLLRLGLSPHAKVLDLKDRRPVPRLRSEGTSRRVGHVWVPVNVR